MFFLKLVLVLFKAEFLNLNVATQWRLPGVSRKLEIFENCLGFLALLQFYLKLLVFSANYCYFNVLPATFTYSVCRQTKEG